MPSIEQNKKRWNTYYDWKDKGNEWSSSWGGVDIQWYGTILPRIHRFIPTGTILEIAPGYGRWTEFLKEYCEQLIIVDLSEKCIEECQKRFSSCSNITYLVNDGKSLDMIADESIDFVFSFDSLVHAEKEVINSYLQQLSTKLTKNGVGFIHHSNLGEYSNYYSLLGKILRPLPRGKEFLRRKYQITDNPHWRESSMTAKNFEQYAKDTNLQCINQEIINWGSKNLIDCLSTFTKNNSKWKSNNRIMRNNKFMREAKYLKELSKLYGNRC
ncbi:class I SAM-dependent methyltransferase [Crocosphaera sp.]|uniref:class I SAM-dependent methyltransferase n=1 Tax=Crocosphaera sp. TaxID=2729996 RepID=UPI0026158402|nr:class I SAM-dependent methyltransferase [Crocosphaera sp.]MDJ0582691.1 class I SAM-dependent methyltransferase [Crocosphaera sp.]